MSQLPVRTLGRTGLEITCLAFGAMELRGAPLRADVSDEDARLILNTVLDFGINYLDTAGCYGLSEERIGRFISHRRSEFYIATKCGCTPGKGAVREDHHYDGANVRAGIENSLRMLQTDYLDVVQFHMSLPPEDYVVQGGLETLRACQDDGKVRFIGVSGTLPNLTRQIETGVYDMFQIPYSVVQRDHAAAMTQAAGARAGVIVRGGIARGTTIAWQARRNYMVSTETMRTLWEGAALDDVLDDMSRVEFTLRYTLSNPDLTATIVGTASPEHLRQNVEFALRGPLPADVIAETNERLDAIEHERRTAGAAS